MIVNKTLRTTYTDSVLSIFLAWSKYYSFSFNNFLIMHVFVSKVCVCVLKCLRSQESNTQDKLNVSP